MTKRGWESKDIIRSAFITPAGNCFLRTLKKRTYCFLKCPITLQVPVTNHMKLVSPARSLAVVISTTDPTAPCPWGTWEQWQEKWEPVERDLWGWEENASQAVAAWPQRLQPLSELLKLGTFAMWKRKGKEQKMKQISFFRFGIQPPPSLWQHASKQIYFR